MPSSEAKTAGVTTVCGFGDSATHGLPPVDEQPSWLHLLFDTIAASTKDNVAQAFELVLDFVC